MLPRRKRKHGTRCLGQRPAAQRALDVWGKDLPPNGLAQSKGASELTGADFCRWRQHYYQSKPLKVFFAFLRAFTREDEGGTQPSPGLLSMRECWALLQAQLVPAILIKKIFVLRRTLTNWPLHAHTPVKAI